MLRGGCEYLHALIAYSYKLCHSFSLSSASAAAITDCTFSAMPTPKDDNVQNTYYSGYYGGHCIKLCVACPSTPGLKRICALDVSTPKVADADCVRDCRLTRRIKGTTQLPLLIRASSALVYRLWQMVLSSPAFAPHVFVVHCTDHSLTESDSPECLPDCRQGHDGRF